MRQALIVEEARRNAKAGREHVLACILFYVCCCACEWEAVVGQKDGLDCPRVVMLVAAHLLHALPTA